MNKTLLETEEDLTLVKDLIMLPIVMSVLELDIKKVNSAGFKVPSVYISMLKTVQYLVTCDMYSTKKRTKELGIKIFDQQSTKMGVEASYLVRGYQHKISMLSSVIKSETQQRLCKYMGIHKLEEG